MSTTTRRVSVRSSSATRVPVLEVLLVGLLRPGAAPRASRRPGSCRRRGRAGGTTAPWPGRSSAARTGRPTRPGWATVSMPSAASLRGLAADPPQRVGRPVPHHLEPVLRGPATPRAACRSRSRSWPALGVADPDRGVQAVARAPGRGRARRSPRITEVLGPSLPGRQERLVPPEDLDHDRHAAPLQRPERVHHLGRGGVVRRGRPAGTPRRTRGPRSAAASRTRPRTPGLRTTPSPPRHARSGRPGRRPPPSPAAGRRSTSTAAMNWSRSTCSTQDCLGGPCPPSAHGAHRSALIAGAAATRRWTRSGRARSA